MGAVMLGAQPAKRGSGPAPATLALRVPGRRCRDQPASTARGAGRGGVGSGNRDRHRPPDQRAAMSDKSPRQTMTKKSGKSLKEKRAAKRAGATEIPQTEAILHSKKR